MTSGVNLVDRNKQKLFCFDQKWTKQRRSKILSYILTWIFFSEFFKVKKPHWSIVSIKETARFLYLHECSNIKKLAIRWWWFNKLKWFLEQKSSGKHQKIKKLVFNHSYIPISSHRLHNWGSTNNSTSHTLEASPLTMKFKIGIRYCAYSTYQFHITLVSRITDTP